MAGEGKKKIIKQSGNENKPVLTESEEIYSLTREQIRELVQDLRIHQVELETQTQELRNTQEELQRNLDKYQELYNSIPVGYFIINKNYSIQEANTTAAKMLGTTILLLQRSRFTDFIASTRQSQDTFHLFMRIALRSGQQQECELEMERSDKSRYLAQIIAMPTDSSLDQFRLMITDITERKQAQEALAKAKDELEIKVEERTEQLEDSYEEIMQSQKALKEANKQLKQYAHKITQVQEEERKRIAYELHDDTAQYLSILKMQIGALANSEDIQNPKVKEKLHFLEKDADRAFNDVRRYSHELRPTTLEHQGLVAAVEQIADDFSKLGQLSVEVHIEGMEPQLSEEVKLGFFRIAQEALNNARKHSKAKQVEIDIRFTHRSLTMIVSDNGEGFDTKQALKKSGSKGSLGLLSMRERADLINSDLKIESEPGKGTKVIVKAKI